GIDRRVGRMDLNDPLRSLVEHTIAISCFLQSPCDCRTNICIFIIEQDCEIQYSSNTTPDAVSRKQCTK
ncbi:MAG TPA: hypothetical protein VGW09_10010, partial [Nitrososphaeraceae archaeon]|nr:hypothetical protein [Nitrososphaeraceae archaeon]